MLRVISVEEFSMIDGISDIPSLLEAIRFSISRSRKPQRLISSILGIDQPQLSRILSGYANFPQDKLLDLMKYLEDYTPLHWLAYNCEFDLVVMDKSLDDENRKLKNENQELKKELDITKNNLRAIGVQIQGLN